VSRLARSLIVSIAPKEPRRNRLSGGLEGEVISNEGPSLTVDPESRVLWRLELRMGEDPARVRNGILLNLIWLAGLGVVRTAILSSDDLNVPRRIRIIIALVAEITAVILIHLLLPPPPLCDQRRPHSVIAAPSSHHAISIFIIIAKALFQASRTGRLEVVGGDGSRDGRRVGAPDVGGIGDPARRAKGWVVKNAGVDGDEALADAVFDAGEVCCAQLV